MKRPLLVILILAILTLLGFVLDVALGSVSLSMGEVFSALSQLPESSNAATIIWYFRIPKALTCLLAGGALAVAGLVMQTLFRNPLAGPDALGLTAGAGLMVAITLLTGLPVALTAVGQSWSLAMAASAGSLLVFLMMILFSRKMTDPVGLLILGLMTAAVTSSLVNVLQYFSRAEELQSFVIWTMGSVGNANATELGVMALVFAFALLLIFSQLKALNLWMLGENYAFSSGIRVTRARLMLVLAGSLLTGVVTAFCGPIAFVGIAVPHLVRLVLPTSHHGWLLPGVMLTGALLLLICDILIQLPGQAQYLPLNAITSLIGAPIVMWVVLRTKNVRL